jgi:hypothetical protein
MPMRWAPETVCPSTFGTLKLRGIAHESANGRPIGPTLACSRAIGLLQRFAVLGEVGTFNLVLRARGSGTRNAITLSAYKASTSVSPVRIRTA